MAEAKQAALAAYEGMWRAYEEAGEPPQADPAHPALDHYATGDALTVLVEGLEYYRQEGLVFVGQAVLAPQVSDLRPEEAPSWVAVDDCADSSGWEVVRADGSPYEDEPGGRRLINAQVEEIGGETWKVTSFAVQGVGTC